MHKLENKIQNIFEIKEIKIGSPDLCQKTQSSCNIENKCGQNYEKSRRKIWQISGPCSSVKNVDEYEGGSYVSHNGNSWKNPQIPEKETGGRSETVQNSGILISARLLSPIELRRHVSKNPVTTGVKKTHIE